MIPLAAKSNLMNKRPSRNLCITALAATLAPIAVTLPAYAQAQPADALIRINCGGPTSGGFAADTGFDLGSVYDVSDPIDLSATANAATNGVYRDERWAPKLEYSIPAPRPPAGKSYTIRLHFAELYDGSAGQRVMDVAINGRTVLSKLDVFAETGAKFKALVKDISGIMPDAAGDITITFTAEAGHADANAAVNGIEILGDGWKPVYTPPKPKHYPFQDSWRPTAERVDDLVSRMTLEQKVSQMRNDAPAIPRLNIPAYGWWNEALHGVARAGIATVFPQAIGLAATWDTDAHYQTATIISDEARAKYNDAIAHDNHAQYYGLDFWSPNINIFRDPRWGRGQETYGEDPYLTGQLGVAFIKGMQGNDKKYFKVIATAKHFAVHSGPEALRHVFDVHPSEYDLHDTYLPAFEAVVRDGHVYSVMGAYNSVDGYPACASPFLLKETLRDTWGFNGYVVSDCGAISDIANSHHFTKTNEEGAADAVKAGCDLACDGAYDALVGAVKQGFITEAQIDVSVKRLFTARIKMGMFDPPASVPWSSIRISENDSALHRVMAAEEARKSIVLLRNEKSILPLSKSIKSVAVIGPNAADTEVLLGNYNGDASHPTSVLQGIRTELAASGTTVGYEKGCDIKGSSKDGFDAAIALAKKSDVVIAVLGLNQTVEGEEGSGGGDRENLDLPGVQEDLLEALAATGKPVVLVLQNGSALSINWAAEHVPAIVEAWYPGEEGGTAVANILFGDFSPAGRLPVTFYKSAKDLPAFTDYTMQGRTYRYFMGTPLYPFGYGLSYTKFEYSALKAPARVKPGKSVKVSVDVKNMGDKASDEVVELYLQPVPAPNVRMAAMPRLALAGFRRVPLAPGETKTVSFTLTPQQLLLVDMQGKRDVNPGSWKIYAGGHQPDENGTNSALSNVVSADIVVK